MTHMTYWAIRHKTNGTYMPVRLSGQGTTWVEFTDPARLPPRLFATQGYAHSVLSRWLKGPTRREAIDPDARAHGYTGKGEPTVLKSYDIGRDRRAYEVVEVSLTLPRLYYEQVDTGSVDR